MKHGRVIAATALFSLVAVGWAQGPKYKLSFSETDAGQVFKAIGQLSGANIVYNVKERISVTLNLTTDSTEEAIQSTVAAAGLAYKRFHTTFIIAKPEDLRKTVHPYTSRIVLRLQIANPVEIAKLLEATMPAVTATGIGSSIAIDAIPIDTVPARDFALQADKTAIQRRSEVVRVRYLAPAQVVGMLATLYPELKTSALGEATATFGAIAIAGNKDDVEAALKAIKELDVAPENSRDELTHELYQVRYSSPILLKQFLTEALPDLRVTVGPEAYSPMQPVFRSLSGQTIGGSSSSGGQSGGGQSNQVGAGGGGAIGGQQGQPSQPFQQVGEGDRAKTLLLQGSQKVVESGLKLLAQFDLKPIQVKVDVRVVDVSPDKLAQTGIDFSWSPFRFIEQAAGSAVETAFDNTRPGGFGQFSRIPWSLDAVLNALVTTREAKILANPSIQVVDNDDALIFIGDTLRVKLQTAGALGAQTVEIREFPIGIILLLRPRVNADGNITMRIHPVVSSLTDISSDGLPQSTTREAESTVMIKDGETVVIGGLIREEMRRTVREIPILGEIPLLGELFKSRRTSTSRSEIMVFITPRIVDEKEAKPNGEGK